MIERIGDLGRNTDRRQFLSSSPPFTLGLWMWGSGWLYFRQEAVS